MLDHPGAITVALAKDHAETQYETFRAHRLTQEDARANEEDAFEA